MKFSHCVLAASYWASFLVTSNISFNLWCMHKKIDQQAISEEIETVFKNLKRYLRMLPASVDHDIVLEENALTYPIPITEKTQSLNHIRVTGPQNLMLQGLIDRKVLAEFCDYNDALPSEYITLVENVLKQEINHKDYYVFYHAHMGPIACLHDIYKLFYSWGFLRRNQPLPIRFVIKGKYPSNLQMFLDQTSTIKIDHVYQTYRYVDTTGETKSANYFDHLPEILDQILSVNVALFGNTERRGESTFFYLTQGRSRKKIDIESTLRTIFEHMQLPLRFYEEIMQTTNSYLEKTQSSGKLLQIFVKKEMVDFVAYWAALGGKPFDKKLFASWDEEKQRHTKISDMLTAYLETPKELDAMMKPQNIDSIQARIWLPSPHLYEPNIVKVLRYETKINRLHHKTYVAALNKIFEDMVKYFIYQKLSAETALWQHAKTPLTMLDDIVSYYKMQKNLQEAQKTIEYMNLEIGTALPVYAEDRFVDLAKTILDKGGIEQEIVPELSSVIQLCKYLPDGSTPLIYAAKTNNIPLLKFLLNLPDSDPQLLARDITGRTASDWCTLTGNKNCGELLLDAMAKKSIKQNQ